MLVELLIAFSFLAVAAGLTLQMHQQQLDFDRASMNRLSDQLALENIAQELAVIDFAQVPESATRLAKEADAEATVAPFETESAGGLHITLSMTSNSGTLRHHCWRLEAQP